MVATSASSASAAGGIPRVPIGFRLTGISCGIKQDRTAEDLTLIVAAQPCAAAGVYTQNRIFAAPVAWDRAITPCADARVVVVNSGNANACTGEQGANDTRTMAQLAADVAGATADQALVMSTGIIGEYLPMDAVRAGIAAAAGQLSNDTEGFQRAARGIMTTDRVVKVAGDVIDTERAKVRVAGMAKGAGMIGPNMATMLGVILTDALLTPDQAQQLLQEVVDQTFNCISVEGHTSTNDTVLLLASGRAGEVPLARLQPVVHQVCESLAKAIPRDGEGASHLIEIHVRGCRTRAEARKIASSVAASALVKTAVTGNDPNWGRVVSAAGYAGVSFDPSGLELAINGTTLFAAGQPVPFDAVAVSNSMSTPDVLIELQFQEGEQACRHWTSDLTAEYIRINAEYHT